MRNAPAALAASLVSALVLGAPPVVADEPANKAAAQALYDQGVKLMEAGNLTEACQRLEDSSKLFEGLGTKARLAECYEKSKRLASAWALYRGALSMADAKKDRRAAELKARVAAIEPRLSKLKVDVPAAARVPGLKVVRDGVELPETLWGVSLPVDGGAHAVEAVASSGTWKGSIKVADERDDATITVKPFEPTHAPPPASSGAVSSASPVATQPPASPGAVDTGAQRTAGLLVGGAGLVGLAVGGYFGLKAIDKKNGSNADGHCNSANICDATGTTLRNDGKSAALLSTVFSGVGIAALVGGTALFLTAPRTPQQGRTTLSPRVDARGGGVVLTGAW